MAVNRSTMLETIEEGLNEVFYDTFNIENLPNVATLEDVFATKSSKKHAEYDLEMRGIGEFSEKGEEEDIAEDFLKEKYKTTYTHVTYANSVPVTKEYIEDELYDVITDNVGELAEAAKYTMYNKGFSIFRNAFSTSFLGADGKALSATDHPRDFGGTLNNKLTAKLTPESLKTAITMLAEQRAHSGRLITNVPATLLVPAWLYPYAVEITEGKDITGTANNGVNVFSAKYNLMIKQTPFIGTSQGGSDHYWFVLAKRTKLKRYQRVPLNTWLTPWDQSRKTVAYYNARYRESYGWSSPIGVVGSDGTTGAYL